MADPAPDFPTELQNAAKAGAALIAKLNPDSQAKIRVAITAVIENDLKPALAVATREILGKVVGGLLGGLAAPGVVKGEDAVVDQLETDVTQPQAAAEP